MQNQTQNQNQNQNQTQTQTQTQQQHVTVWARLQVADLANQELENIERILDEKRAMGITNYPTERIPAAVVDDLCAFAAEGDCSPDGLAAFAEWFTRCTPDPKWASTFGYPQRFGALAARLRAIRGAAHYALEHGTEPVKA